MSQQQVAGMQISPIIKADENRFQERLPPINRSTIKYQFNSEGQEICNHHAFCSHNYEFNDQSHILKPLSQPLSNFNGVQLPPPKDVDNENTQSRGNTAQSAKRQSSKGGSRDTYKQNEIIQKRGGSQLPNNRIGITEEALDDWIAQSQNRPIISFLDPYKKFNVPDKLLNDFRVRYRKWLKTKERDFEKKLLYFEDRSKINNIPHHQLPTRRPREAEKNITFRYKELQPKSINGTSIVVRENNVWKNISSKIQNSSFENSQFLDTYDDQAAKDTSQFLKNIDKKDSQSPQQRNKQNSDHLQLNHTRLRGNNKSFHVSQNAGERNASSNDNNKSFNIQNSNIKRNGQPFNSSIDISYNQNVQGGNNNISTNELNRNINLVPTLKQRVNGAYINFSKQNDSTFINNSQSNAKKSENSGENLRTVYHGLIPRIEMLLKDEDKFKIKGQTCLTQTSPRLNEKQNNSLNNSFNNGNLSQLQQQQQQNNTNLNNNQTFIIDSTQRKSFDKHVECITEVPKIEKNLMTEVEFSFWKAVRRIQKNSHMQAVQCLKETLLYDKLHGKSIFNLGCLYEYLGQYETSKKWFDVALKLNENPNQAKYGLAICNYKLGNYESCFENIDQVIRCSSEPSQEHLYLRAVCNKKLEKLESAANDYQQFIEYTCPSNFNMLMHLMFAMIFKNKRDLNVKVEPKVFCEFNSLVSEIITSSEYIPALQPFWEDNQWVDIHFLIKRLKLLSFFNRFEENDLKKILSTMKFSTVPKKKIIFPKANEVLVIVAGHILVQDHINNLEHPDIISYFSEGDIIGFEEKDNGLCTIPDIWFASQTEVETLSFPKSTFVDLWKKHSFNLIKMQILNFIQQIPIFNGVSELTLYRLAFEIITTQTFNRGDIIFNDGECAEQIKYIELKKNEGKTKNVAERMNNKMTKLDFIKRKINGFYIVREGICELETPTGWLDYKLSEGDYFGESLMFNTLNVNRFGRIKAKSEKVECYFLPRLYFEKIPLLDKNIMQSNCHKSPRFKECQRYLVQAFKTQI
ncbi:hypothetical protein ABPG74_012697 [Tetrahymena malaccensis]